MIEVLILSIVQGITEFLPISSSSHLILVSEFMQFENQSLSIDVSLHIGSFFAVLLFFKKDILNFYANRILLFKIVLASLPVMIVGYFLATTGYIDKIRDIKIIAWTTIIFGLLLFCRCLPPCRSRRFSALIYSWTQKKPIPNSP